MRIIKTQYVDSVRYDLLHYTTFAYSSIYCCCCCCCARFCFNFFTNYTHFHRKAHMPTHSHSHFVVDVVGCVCVCAFAFIYDANHHHHIHIIVSSRNSRKSISFVVCTAIHKKIAWMCTNACDQINETNKKIRVFVWKGKLKKRSEQKIAYECVQESFASI